VGILVAQAKVDFDVSALQYASRDVCEELHNFLVKKSVRK
jgi:hypothetical protein